MATLPGTVQPSEMVTTTGWAIPTDSDRGRITIASRFLVDARGRRTMGGRSGIPTVALYGRWHGDAVTDATHMLVDVAHDAWFWAATRPDGSNVVVYLSIDDRHRRLLHDPLLIALGGEDVELGLAHEVMPLEQGRRELIEIVGARGDEAVDAAGDGAGAAGIRGQ
jgi:hypothetical protein